MTTYHSTVAVLHIIVLANSGTLATQRFEGSSRDPGWDPHSHKLPMTLTLESLETTAASFSDPNCALHLLVSMGLSENSVPLHPMVDDHYPY